jgi:hypothetical protein
MRFPSVLAAAMLIGQDRRLFFEKMLAENPLVASLGAGLRPDANPLRVFLVQIGVPVTRIGFVIVATLVAAIDSDRLTIATSRSGTRPSRIRNRFG